MRVVLVPGVLALLPEYGGLSDPVLDLRLACLEAVAWLGDGFGVHGSLPGLRLARHLAAEAGVELDLFPERPAGMLVVANGSACRSEKAPGHLDPRAAGFDEALGSALRAGELDELDLVLADELLADVASLAWMREELRLGPAEVDYEADPFGVQYWVMRWEGEWR